MAMVREKKLYVELCRPRPFAQTIFTWWVISGLMTIASGFIPAFNPSIVTSELSGIMSVIIGVFIAASGMICLYGLTHEHASNRGWMLEEFGLWLAIVSWLSIAITDAMLWPWALEHSGSSLAFSIGSALRLRQIYSLRAFAESTNARPWADWSEFDGGDINDE